jgi:hypothetical protein
LRLDIGIRCVGYLPRFGAVGLVRSCEFRDLPREPVRVLDDPGTPANLDDGIVLGGHNLTGFALGLVP